MSLALLDFTITDADLPFAITGMSTYVLHCPPPVIRLSVRGGRGMSPDWLLGAVGLKMSGDEAEEWRCREIYGEGGRRGGEGRGRGGGGRRGGRGGAERLQGPVHMNRTYCNTICILFHQGV